MAIIIFGTLPFIGPRLVSRLVEKTGTLGKNPLECEVVEEFEFLKWYTDSRNYGKGTFAKEKVNAVVRKHACGRNEDAKMVSIHFVLKIIYKFNIILIFFSIKGIFPFFFSF